MNCLDMVVSLSNQKCRFSRPEQLQDLYIIEVKWLKYEIFEKYSRFNGDCFVLAFEVEFGSSEA